MKRYIVQHINGMYWRSGNHWTSAKAWVIDIDNATLYRTRAAAQALINSKNWDRDPETRRPVRVPNTQYRIVEVTMTLEVV